MPIARTLTVLAALLLAWQPGSAASSAALADRVTVSFSADLEQRLHDSYGDAERESLRRSVVEALGYALGGAASDVRVEVALVDARPSHPTREQLIANPAMLDPLRSVSLGGAELAGTIRAPDGRVLATLSYQYFAPDLALVAPTGDPWGDARVAIERFATRLAARLAPRH